MAGRILTEAEAEERMLELELQEARDFEALTDADWDEEMADVEAYDAAVRYINRHPEEMLYGDDFLDALKQALKI